MSEFTPERIAELRQDDMAGWKAMPAALDEIERLRSRLELDSFTDGDGNPVSNADGRLDAYDGIACRDATIKLQDAEIERLQERDQRREQLLREHAGWLEALAEEIAREDQPGWPNALREQADRIWAELEDAKPRTPAEAIYGSENGR